MLRQHTTFPRTLAHHDVCPTPPHPRPRQELEARLAPRVSSSAQRTTSSTSPQPKGYVRKLSGAEHFEYVGARARSAHTTGAERISARRRPGCRRRPGAQRQRHRRRARSARRRWQPAAMEASGDGSQRLPRPAHRRAAPSAPSAGRVARGGGSGSQQAPGRAAPAPSAPSA